MKTTIDAPRTAAAARAAEDRTIDRLLLAAAWALPVLVLGLVLRLGVNVPFSDEWDFIPYVFHAQNGTLTLDELWRQHNEHRMFFASLMVLALAKLGGWNLIREEVVSVLLCAAVQCVLWRLVRRTLPPAATPIAFAAMALALWNTGQAENFAMGLQMGWWLLLLCVVVVAWRLCAAPRRPRDIIIAGVAATVASYCSELGLLAWAVGAVAIALSEGPRRAALAGWFVWGVAAYALFRAGMAEVQVDHVPVLANAGVLVVYALAYLGVPLAFWAGLAGCVTAGTALVIGFAALAVADARDARTDPTVLHRRAVWYALAAFAMLGAIGTGPSRLGLGLGGVVTSTRYILVGSWLTIAVIALAAMRFPVRIDWRTLRLTPAAALIVVLTVATAFSWVRGYRDWQYFSMFRKADLAALRSGNLAAVAPYYPTRSILMTDIDELRRLHDGPLGP